MQTDRTAKIIETITLKNRGEDQRPFLPENLLEECRFTFAIVSVVGNQS